MFGYKKLLRNYNNFIFVSPHLDDAILSCGYLITDLIKLKKEVILITVFTKALSKTITPQARSFLKNCGYKSAAKLFKDRKAEDIGVSKFLNTNHICLNFIDAAWRLNNKRLPIYTKQEIQFSGKVLPYDKTLAKTIKTRLVKIISRNKSPLVLSPLGIGGHVDHIIVRKIINNLVCSKIFWEDYPYNTNRKNIKDFFIQNKKFRPLFTLRRFRFSQKDKLIRFYKSQINCLFPSGRIPHINEKYYFVKNSKPF